MTTNAEPWKGMADDDRQKLRSKFLHQPAETHTRKWDELWQQNTTPWDRKGPSLALKDAVTDHADILGLPLVDPSSGKRKKALVPGCGRGYDVLLLGALGYDSYGLDASPTAIAAAQQLLDESRDSDTYAAAEPQQGRGAVTFLLHDFFTDDFLAATAGGAFDLIFDYTFLCALPPELRPRWSRRMSELLAPGGHLICLEWPLGKDPHEGGPPHGLTSDLYVQLLAHPGSEPTYDAAGFAVAKDGAGEQEGEDALVRAAHFQPPRTHAAGKGKDYVSIWKHVGT